jgi:plasmid stabilization system protein ParE
MSFVVRKLRLAEEDALEAALWYEEREPGLGEDFLNEVENAIQSLIDGALLYHIRFGEVRRAPLRRFKYYGVYYIVVDQEVRVIAIYHGRRHPKFLEQRRRSV